MSSYWRNVIKGVQAQLHEHSASSPQQPQSSELEIHASVDVPTEPRPFPQVTDQQLAAIFGQGGNVDGPSLVRTALSEMERMYC